VDASSIELRLAGYCPRNVIPPRGWLTGREQRGIEFVCSLSDHVSTGPADRFDLWIHNDLGLFNQPDQARRVIGPDDPPMTMFGYRVSTMRFVDGEPELWAWPDDADPVPLPPAFLSLGFDAVHKYMDSILGFERSPLSCNSLAAEWPVNRHCLLDDLPTAIEAARRFSIEKPEPGMYYVAEVFAEPF
jgi:hypothetical protein